MKRDEDKIELKRRVTVTATIPSCDCSVTVGGNPEREERSIRVRRCRRDHARVTVRLTDMAMEAIELDKAPSSQWEGLPRGISEEAGRFVEDQKSKAAGP